MILTGESMEHRWNDTDRGVWSIGGMILTGESMEQWWNDTDRGEYGALVE